VEISSTSQPSDMVRGRRTGELMSARRQKQ